MNKLTVFALCIMLFACKEQTETAFTVQGTIANTGEGTIYLELNTPESRPVIVDSARIGENGNFQLDAEAIQQSLYSLRTNQSPYPFAILINDGTKITVNADPMKAENAYSVKGSEASQHILDFEKALGTQSFTLFSLKKEIDSVNTMAATDSASQRTKDSLLESHLNRYTATISDMKQKALGFINQSKSPMFILYAIGSFQVRSRQIGEAGFSRIEIAEILNKAGSRFPDHTALQDQRKKLGDSKAPEINLPDTSGRMVSLSSLRGKYVLVDFWASWCKPCRMENPNIVAAYKEFRDKNFTILGVSLDKEKSAWLQAIKTDSLQWTHISDLQFWNSAAAQTYGVNSIPYNVLVDPQGNIIAEALHGPQLLNTLQRVLK